MYRINREGGFGDEVKRRIMIGTYSLSAGYADKYYIQAAKVRRLITKEFDDVFKKVDLLAAPTAPTTAFKLGEKYDDPLTMYMSDIFTIPATLAGLPAISVPAGEAESLPVGMQLIGPQFSEPTLLSTAKQFENLIK